jgi:ankyrin repeat protein
LTWAFSFIHPDTCKIAELLLSRGAYVDPICKRGTPLHIAAQNGNVRMVELLLRHQANVIAFFSIFGLLFMNNITVFSVI